MIKINVHVYLLKKDKKNNFSSFREEKSRTMALDNISERRFFNKELLGSNFN